MKLGKSGYKGSGEYVITLGGKNAKDNFPQARAFSVKSEPIPTQIAQKDAGKSTPGFTVFASIISLIAIGIFKRME
jgi:hypothetical protein